MLAENHGTNLAVQNDINEIIDSNKSSPSNLFSKDNSSDPDFEPNNSDITDNDNSKENKLRKSRICRGRSRRAREKAKLLRNTGQAYKSKSGKTVRGRVMKTLTNCRMKCKNCFSDKKGKLYFLNIGSKELI